MSCAANPGGAKRDRVETEAAQAARLEKADRERIRCLIITLGDESKKVVSQVRGLVGALEDDVELHGELMAETVLDCARSLPLKPGVFAAWTARMAEKHSAWAASVISRAVEELRAALRAGQATAAQLLLRFLVGLANTGTLGTPPVVGLLKEVLALSDGLRPAKGGDFGVFLAVASLPFLSPAAHAMVVEQVGAIIDGAEAYLASRDARWKPLLRLFKSDDPPDRLEALVSAVRSHRRAGWAAQTVFLVPGFEPSLEGRPEMPQLAPLGVTAEDIRRSKVRMQVPLVSSRMITSQLENDGADDQLSEHDRWILEDYILTAIETFGRDVEECSKQILRIPILHQHFDAIVLETVFSAMLRLPSPLLLPLFYSRLLEALVDKQSSMVKVVEQAFSALFRRAPDLDEECLEVLAEAFAYHLMHNSYTADWTPLTGDTVTVQAQRFLRRALERLQRLSFHQNLLHRLPEAVHVYVPPEPLAANGLPAQAKPEFARMLGFVRIKEPNEQKVLYYCQRLLKSIPKEEQKEEEARPEGGPCAPAVPGVEVARAEDQKAKRGPEDVEANTGEASPKRQRTGDASEQAPDVVLEEAKGEPAGKDGEVDPRTGLLESKEAVQFMEPLVAEPSMELSVAEPKASDNVAEPGTLQVKEEVKQEDERAGGAAEEAQAPEAKAEGTTKQDAEDEFGEVPAEPWPLAAVVELFLLALLQHGAKTPTHMSKMLDGHHQIFAKLRPSEDEEAHAYVVAMVRCIFDFWRLSGQRLEITLDALLHRGVVTPRAVVEQALAQRGPHGCDSMSVWNMISSVARKSLEHSQSMRVELAIAKKLGKVDVLERCRKQLDSAVHETAELFTLIFTGLVRNHQDFEDSDIFLRKITLERVLTIGRKYHAFIKPLIDAAESRIPGVAHNPEIAAIFHSLKAL